MQHLKVLFVLVLCTLVSSWRYEESDEGMRFNIVVRYPSEEIVSLFFNLSLMNIYVNGLSFKTYL